MLTIITSMSFCRVIRTGLAVTAVVLGVTPMVGGAQANFVIPVDSITDFTYYDRIETCYALSNRMTKQLSRKQDSINLKRQIFVSRPVDTTSQLLRWSVQQCMQKFGVSSLAQHDSVARGKTILDKALRLYYEGKYQDRFFTVVDSIMQPSQIEKKDTGYRAYVRAFAPVQSAMGTVDPTDYGLIDSLQDRYVVPAMLKDKASGNLQAAYAYYKLMFDRVDRTYNDSSVGTGAPVYRQWVARVQSDLGAQMQDDTSKTVRAIRRLMRSAYDKINYVAVLDSLRLRGPDGYFNALEVNHKLAGFTTERDYENGVSTPMITPLAFAAYRFTEVDDGKIQGTTWHASKPENPEVVTNTEYRLSAPGQPYVLFSMNALCREENKFPLRWMRSSVRSHECWGQYAYIKWFHEEYPQIPITILTRTVGHFGELATTNPYEEAEIIKDAWWGFHHLPATIVVYHLNFFNMPDLDQRREDVVDENLLQFRKRSGVRPGDGMPKSMLVDPEGRILTTLPFSWNGVKKTKEIVDPFYTWYQQRYRSTGQSATAKQ